MIRALITFKDGESLLFSTMHIASIDKMEQRLSKPLPWTLQTEKGPVQVDRLDVDHIVIQRVEAGRVIEQKTMIPQESVVSEQPIEEVPVFEPTAEILQGKEIMDELVAIPEPTVETPEGEEIVADQPDVIIPEIVDDNDPRGQTVALITSVHAKFVSFRDKFFGQNAEAETWQDRIVEKQAEYIDNLKETYSELDKRNANAKGFKDEIVGK